MSLNAKQRKFCENYVSGMSAFDAYSKSGYSPSNERTAAASASKLLTNGNIQEYIQHLQRKATTRTIMSRTEVLQALSDIGRSNIKDVASWDASGVTLRDSESLEDHVTAGVKEVTETNGENSSSIKIKQHDKVKSLELLAKHYGALDGKPSGDDSGDEESSVSRVLNSIRKLRK